jgi:hypothetical protein
MACHYLTEERMADQPDALGQLADFLTGTSVGFLSVALGMSGGHPLTKTANRFFDLRKALGVHGYATKEEALPAIRAALGVQVVGHACKLDGSICESRQDRCSDCPTKGAQ